MGLPAVSPMLLTPLFLRGDSRGSLALLLLLWRNHPRLCSLGIPRRPQRRGEDSLLRLVSALKSGSDLHLTPRNSGALMVFSDLPRQAL